ncbi:MAG: M20 family metallo-hydrolase [Bacteroidales bacterium]|nr:M20 family metallo-hydrolase [Bacteroidales bacterium]
MIDNLHKQAIDLLISLIEIPSVSRDEAQTADIIEGFLQERAFKVYRKHNNVWVKNISDLAKPTVLLNSHHDTVKPVSSWTKDPFMPVEDKGKIYGLGSNDAGASLVSLMMTFLYLTEKKDNPYNYIFLASAEEEISGQKGIASVLDDLGEIDFAIVGEPTAMQAAIAEKGLIVMDCRAHGKAGHAARNEGINAINIALDDIHKIRNFRFEKSSAFLGDVKMTVTQINGGTQHNVVPETCDFVIDVRTNEHYSNKEVYETIDALLQSEVKPRSLRLNSSSIDENHEMVKKIKKLGIKTYGSPTLSDQALMNFPSLKMGPGQSKRSHTADEFIYKDEIKQAIETYIKILS